MYKPPSYTPDGPLFTTIILSFTKVVIELIVVVNPRTLRSPEITALPLTFNELVLTFEPIN